MADDSVVKLKVNGQLYEVDFEDLELGEVGVVEDLTGESVNEIDWDSARGMQGLVWIAMHRKNPQFSIVDAGRIKFSALSDPDKAPPNGKGGSKGKSQRPTKAA